MTIREIEQEDNSKIAAILRYNFELYNQVRPGTAYFDPELENLSGFYNAKPEKRKYYVLLDDNGEVCGGCGFAEFDYFENCAEIQKLYLAEPVKGRGYGNVLLKKAEDEAIKAGYKKLYIETVQAFNIAVHLYEKFGYKPIERRACVQHAAMDTFLIKEI